MIIERRVGQEVGGTEGGGIGSGKTSVTGRLISYEIREWVYSSRSSRSERNERKGDNDVGGT